MSTRGAGALEFRLERLKKISDLRDQTIRDYFDGVPKDTKRGMCAYWDNYLNGTDEFHLHLNTVRPLCLTYRSAVATAGKHGTGTHNRDTKAGTSRSEFPMLVWIREVAEKLRPITPVVRLQPLDCCDMCAAETLKSGRYVFREFLWFIVDRKLSAVLNDAGIMPSQFKD